MIMVFQTPSSAYFQYSGSPLKSPKKESGYFFSKKMTSSKGRPIDTDIRHPQIHLAGCLPHHLQKI